MEVKREDLGNNFKNYEQAKGKPAVLPEDQRNLALSKQLSASLLPKPKRRHRIWEKSMTMHEVSRRIYQSVPDAVVISSDWLSSWMMERADDQVRGAVAILYLGYLLRYGFWDADGYLFWSDEMMVCISRQSRKTVDQQKTIRKWLVDNGLLIPKTGEEDSLYQLNSQTIRLVNEKIEAGSKERMFVEVKYKTTNPVKIKAA